jgi:hypothetical protein
LNGNIAEGNSQNKQFAALIQARNIDTFYILNRKYLFKQRADEKIPAVQLKEVTGKP